MISHSHRFIFFHIPKTGGTSVSANLMPMCDEKTYRVGHPEFFKYEKMHLTNYIKFTFVRNPYDRLVGAFNYIKSGQSKFKTDIELKDKLKIDNFCFSEFIKNKLFKWEYHLHHFRPVIGFYINKTDLNKFDFIGKFENLQEDFDIVCDKIGIPQQKLPHKNKTKHKHYTEYYDDETRSIVAEKYAKDIEYFGYEFGE